MTPNRLRATVWHHSWVDWHFICTRIQLFCLTLPSQRLKSTGNCVTILSKLHFQCKRSQWPESCIRWCLDICCICEPSHHGWPHQYWRKSCTLQPITSESAISSGHNHHQIVNSKKSFFFSLFLAEMQVFTPNITGFCLDWSHNFIFDSGNKNSNGIYIVLFIKNRRMVLRPSPLTLLRFQASAHFFTMRLPPVVMNKLNTSSQIYIQNSWNDETGFESPV